MKTVNSTREFRLIEQKDRYEVISFNIYETEIINGQRWDNGILYSFDNLPQAQSKLNFIKLIY